jgi:hypothetical protein
MALREEDVIEFIPREERRQERLNEGILDFIAGAADYYLDPTIPLPEGEGLLTHDSIIQRESLNPRESADPREIIGGRSVVKSRRFTSISFYDITAGTLEANTTGPTITFKEKAGGQPLQGAEALARARQVFGRDAK